MSPRIGRAIAGAAWIVAGACLAWVMAAVVFEGFSALRTDLGSESPPGRLLWISVPMRLLLAVPLLSVAAWRASRQRSAGAWIAAAAWTLLTASAVHGGPASAAWLVAPLAALLTALLLGTVAGGLAAILGLGAFAAVFVAGHDEAVVRLGEVNARWWAGSYALSLWASMVIGSSIHGRLFSEPAGAGESGASREAAPESRYDHAMRMDTVGDMAGLVAHQVRNRLQLVMGDVALVGGDDPAAREKRFRRITAEIECSTRLLQQLLELAHPDPGHATRVDLNEFCRRFAETAIGLLPARIELRTVIAEEPLVTRIDRRGLEHALLNLVINAVQAIEGSGCVTLSLERRDGSAHIRIRDTGAGIPEADLSRIFQPYFTTKPPGKGTGLGLVAVHRYVTAAGGRVGVQSRPGAGATFWLEFPLAELGGGAGIGHARGAEDRER